MNRRIPYSICAPLRPHSGRHGAQITVVAMLMLGGCAERGLTAGPQDQPSTTTWTAVWIAGVLGALLIGVLLTLPAWRRRGGARLAVTVLTVQTGAVATVGLVLTATAVRSWQLVDKPADAELAISLLRLSRVDGDGSFLMLMTLLLGAVTLLATTVSAAAARLAAGSDGLERSVASALLAVEVGIAGYLGGDLLLGQRGMPYVGGALAFPLLVAAFIACWPRRTATQ